jgi:hypothetical protein
MAVAPSSRAPEPTAGATATDPSPRQRLNNPHRPLRSPGSAAKLGRHGVGTAPHEASL